MATANRVRKLETNFFQTGGATLRAHVGIDEANQVLATAPGVPGGGEWFACSADDVTVNDAPDGQYDITFGSPDGRVKAHIRTINHGRGEVWTATCDISIDGKPFNVGQHGMNFVLF